MPDRTLQARWSRSLWAAAHTAEEKLYWKFHYVRVRYLLACRRSDKGLSEIWRKVHSELEDVLLRLGKQVIIQQAARSQDFSKPPMMLRNDPSASAFRENVSNLVRSAQGPHSWNELASVGEWYRETEDADEDDYLAEDSDASEDKDRMSWREFYEKICAFERKILAERRQTSLPQQSHPWRTPRENSSTRGP